MVHNNGMPLCVLRKQQHCLKLSTLVCVLGCNIGKIIRTTLQDQHIRQEVTSSVKNLIALYATVVIRNANARAFKMEKHEDKEQNAAYPVASH